MHKIKPIVENKQNETCNKAPNKAPTIYNQFRLIISLIIYCDKSTTNMLFIQQIFSIFALI